MLSERESQLLTSYVDGALDASERQAVDALLASSPEACRLLHKLTSDSREVHDLPFHYAPGTLTSTVMQRIGTEQILPAEPDPPVARTLNRIPWWLGLTAAACILAVVGLASYFVAGKLLREKSTPARELADAEAPENLDTGIRLGIAEILDKPLRQHLTTVLKDHSGCWLDVPALNAGKANERVTTAFKQIGVTVLADSAVKEKLAKKPAEVRCVFYVENVSHEEATKLLQNIARAERRGATKSIDWIVMTEFNQKKLVELAKAMAVEPSSLDPKHKEMILPALVEVPGGQIQKPAAAAAPKVPERFAVMLALSGAGNPAESPELQKFLASRQGLRHGTLQLVLVVHEKSV